MRATIPKKMGSFVVCCWCSFFVAIFVWRNSTKVAAIHSVPTMCVFVSAELSVSVRGGRLVPRGYLLFRDANENGIHYVAFCPRWDVDVIFLWRYSI